MNSESGKQKLHSVLFGGQNELENFKLFPGTGRELTSETLADAAADAFSQAMRAWTDGVPSTPPTTGRPKRQLVG